MTNRRPNLACAALLVVIGLGAWAILWTSGLPRVRYDTLWYASFTYEDAGLPREAAWTRSWDLLDRYGSPELVAGIPRVANGSWFEGWDDPKRARWVGIYAMRPAMPVLGALTYAVLGTDAPVAVSVLAVVLLVVAGWVVVGPLAGAGVAAAFLAIDALNPLLSTWLIFLMPDGLGLGLWLLAIGSAARYAAAGGQGWLATASIATLALAFDRPSAVLVPAILAASALVAVVGRGPWRRFGLGALGTGAAAGLFTGWAAVMGYPSFHDFLEDLPTNHFAKLDVSRPVDEMLPYAEDLVRATPAFLLAHPLIAVAIVLGVAGLVLARRWWTVPYLVALPAIAALALAHPVATEVERTVAPAWLSIDLGLALLVGRVARAAAPRLGVAQRAAAARLPANVSGRASSSRNTASIARP